LREIDKAAEQKAVKPDFANMPDLAAYARWYADSGYRIFPCAPGGKEPLTEHGYHDASTNAATVERWWAKHPDANVALPLAANGLVAIDVDLYKPECGWTEFIAGKAMPDTWTQESARGGYHFIFRAPPDARFAGKLAVAVEIKHRGYVMLAPSIFEGGRYRRITPFKPAPAPDWLLAVAPAAASPASTNLIVGRNGYGVLDADSFRVCLAQLDPTSFGDLFEVIPAAVFVTAGTDAACEVFVAWAANRRAAYRTPRKQAEVRRRWRDVEPGRVTLGTFIYLLREVGADEEADGVRLMAIEADDEAFAVEDREAIEFQLDAERLVLTDQVVKEPTWQRA
jgi:hypothetical protein